MKRFNLLSMFLKLSYFISCHSWSRLSGVSHVGQLLYIYVSIYLCIYLSIYLSVYLSVYLIYLSMILQPFCWTLATNFSVSWSYRQLVGFLRRGISPSQGRHLHTEQHKHRINTTQTSMPWVGFEPRSHWLSERRSSCISPRGHRGRHLRYIRVRNSYFMAQNLRRFNKTNQDSASRSNSKLFVRQSSCTN
jgi:hypothetical protein